MQSGRSLTFHSSMGVDDLIGAFHQIRNLVLQGLIPVVFWHEFDASKFKWLQYLLAPMQDGRFQQGEATHTIGKCILSSLAVHHGLSTLWVNSRLLDEADQFRLAKQSDFKSRLDGGYDILGPNQSLIP